MATRRLTGTLSLRRFILRSEVLRLYRDLLRVVKRIPDKNQQAELRQWIRTDFNNSKHLVDEAAIRMMVTRGRMSLKELEQSIGLAS